MKFRYFKFPLPEKSEFFGASILRPIIPLDVTVGDITVAYAALIDSGADFCIFDSGFGEILGIDVQSGKRIQFGGVQANMPSQAYLHEITISIGGSRHKILAGFSYDIASHGYGLLGQKGFFDKFIVKFDLLKEEIELKERK